MESRSMEREKELSYLYWLHSIDGIGPKTMAVLQSYAGSAEEIYRLQEGELKWLLNQRQMQNLQASRKTWDVETEYQILCRKGIRLLPYGYPDYPEKFANLPDPPAILYVKGSLPDTTCHTIAMIGTRKCSGYGSMMARQLGTALAEAGVQVVSGLARGIDGIGQRAVVEAGGRTFAVLGCGVDICYPLENQRLYERIPEQGGILSEYPPGTQPKAQLFPPRNRIISGLSDGVLVVEAKEKSGTMITVDMALEQGKEVYALPGRLVDGQSGGCNRLIKQGAIMVVSIEDFLWELGIDGKKTKAEKATGGSDITIAELTDEERQVNNCLDYEPKSLEYVAECCPDMPIYRLPQILVSLCLKGLAEQMGVGFYCKKKS